MKLVISTCVMIDTGSRSVSGSVYRVVSTHSRETKKTRHTNSSFFSRILWGVNRILQPRSEMGSLVCRSAASRVSRRELPSGSAATQRLYYPLQRLLRRLQ